MVPHFVQYQNADMFWEKYGQISLNTTNHTSTVGNLPSKDACSVRGEIR